MCTYTYVYIQIDIYIYAYTYIFVYIYIYIYIYIYSYTFTYLYTYIYIFMFMHIYMNIHEQSEMVCKHGSCIQPHDLRGDRTIRFRLFSRWLGLEYLSWVYYTYVFTTHTYICVNKHTLTQIHTHTHARTRIYNFDSFFMAGTSVLITSLLLMLRYAWVYWT